MSLERWCITQYVSGIVLNVPYMWYDGIRRVKCHTDRAREEINWRSSRARVFSSDRRIAEIRLIANSQVSIRKSIGFYLIRNWDKSLFLFSRSNPSSFVTRKISISKSIWSFDTTRQTFVRIKFLSLFDDSCSSRNYSSLFDWKYCNRSRQIEYHIHNWTFRLGSKHSLNGSPAIP